MRLYMDTFKNEHELIKKIQLCKDHKSYTIIMNHYHKRINHYCQHLCYPDLALADDITQDTFYQMYQKINLFSGKGSLQCWLCKVAYFQFLHSIKKKHGNNQLIDNVISEDDSLAYNIKHDLEIGLSQLKKIEQKCIRLQFLYGYSQNEVAKKLHLPVNTVKSHSKQGKDKLTNYFASI